MASLQARLVMRLLLVANGMILAAISTLYGVSGSYVLAGVLGGASLALWALIPLTDPYRGQ